MIFLLFITAFCISSTLFPAATNNDSTAKLQYELFQCCDDLNPSAEEITRIADAYNTLKEASEKQGYKIVNIFNATSKRNGYTPLTTLIVNNASMEAVQSLLEAKAYPDLPSQVDPAPPIELAARIGRLDSVALLVAYGGICRQDEPIYCSIERLRKSYPRFARALAGE